MQMKPQFYPSRLFSPAHGVTQGVNKNPVVLITMPMEARMHIECPHVSFLLSLRPLGAEQDCQKNEKRLLNLQVESSFLRWEQPLHRIQLAETLDIRRILPHSSKEFHPPGMRMSAAHMWDHHNMVNASGGRSICMIKEISMEEDDMAIIMKEDTEMICHLGADLHFTGDDHHPIMMSMDQMKEVIIPKILENMDHIDVMKRSMSMMREKDMVERMEGMDTKVGLSREDITTTPVEKGDMATEA